MSPDLKSSPMSPLNNDLLSNTVPSDTISKVNQDAPADTTIDNVNQDAAADTTDLNSTTSDSDTTDVQNTRMN
jgi:hypothetical protein